MATNDEIRALLLSLQAQMDSNDAAPVASGEDRLPELAAQLADHLVHPGVLREVLLSMDARIRELETADDYADAPVPEEIGGGE